MNCSIKKGCYNVMPCEYSYLQVNFYKRFDGAVSITAVLKESKNKVEGSSPSKTFFYFLFFALAKKQEIFRDLHVCRKKHVLMYYAHVKRLHLVKWRYSNDAGAIIENVYKFCMEEKTSGMKLSLNRVWDRTAALTGVSRSTTQKMVEEKKAQDHGW